MCTLKLGVLQKEPVLSQIPTPLEYYICHSFFLAAIFVVTFLLLGFNLSIALIVTFTVAIIIVNLMGLMYIWNISLNAVSLVNLVMVCMMIWGLMFKYSG